MNQFFLSEVENLKKILDQMKELVSVYNANIVTTHYYLLLGNKNLLQVIEETLSNHIKNKKEKKKHIKLLKTFLKRSKKLHFLISSLDDPKSIEMKSRMEEAFISFGFTEKSFNQVFSLELENAIQRLEKEVVL